MRYIYIYRTNFRMLEVRDNKIALSKLSGGSAQLRTIEVTLIATCRNQSESIRIKLNVARSTATGQGLQNRRR